MEDQSDGPLARQTAELELLQSMYDPAVLSSHEGPCLNLSLALTPLHDSQHPDYTAKVTLNVQCDEVYPDR